MSRHPQVLGRGKRVMSSNIRKCKKHKKGGKLDNTQRRNEALTRDLNFWLPLIKNENLPIHAQGVITIPQKDFRKSVYFRCKIGCWFFM